jgi:hypothetical protein
MDPYDHMAYVSLSAESLVTLLRLVRDEYSSYLKTIGVSEPATPLVVFCFAVVPCAVAALQGILGDYVEHSGIHSKTLQDLFDVPESFGSWGDRPAGTASELVSESTLRLNVRGGPFGRDAQVIIAKRNWPLFWYTTIGRTVLPMRKTSFPLECDNLADAIQQRLCLWDRCQPWAGAMAQLFAIAQQELEGQYTHYIRSLSQGTRTDLIQIVLTPFEQVAYKHIVRALGSDRNLTREQWMTLVEDLDAREIKLTELDPSANTVRRRLKARLAKGDSEAATALDTWKGCYCSSAVVVLDDSEKRLTMKRGVQRSLHNAVTRAKRKIERIGLVHEPDPLALAAISGERTSRIQ